MLILTFDLSISSYCSHLFDSSCTSRLTDPSKWVPDHWVKNTMCKQQSYCHKAFQTELEWRWRKSLNYSFQQAGHLCTSNTWVDNFVSEIILVFILLRLHPGFLRLCAINTGRIPRAVRPARVAGHCACRILASSSTLLSIWFEATLWHGHCVQLESRDGW